MLSNLNRNTDLILVSIFLNPNGHIRVSQPQIGLAISTQCPAAGGTCAQATNRGLVDGKVSMISC